MLSSYHVLAFSTPNWWKVWKLPWKVWVRRGRQAPSVGRVKEGFLFSTGKRLCKKCYCLMMRCTVVACMSTAQASACLTVEIVMKGAVRFRTSRTPTSCAILCQRSQGHPPAAVVEAVHLLGAALHQPIMSPRYCLKGLWIEGTTASHGKEATTRHPV